MLWAFPSHGKFSENFKLVSQRKQNPCVVRPITRGKVMEVSLWSVRGGSGVGTILERRIVVLSGDRSWQCQD